MQDLETKLDAIFASLETLQAREHGRPLPLVLTFKQASEQLSISVRKLRYMISEGQIAPCEVGDSRGIPLSEIQRIATPKATPGARRSGGRPRAKKVDARSEAEKARAMLKAAQKRR